MIAQFTKQPVSQLYPDKGCPGETFMLLPLMLEYPLPEDLAAKDDSFRY
jgi:hypothetical protein